MDFLAGMGVLHLGPQLRVPVDVIAFRGWSRFGLNIALGRFGGRAVEVNLVEGVDTPVLRWTGSSPAARRRCSISSGEPRG